MSIPFKGYLYSVMDARMGSQRVAIHVFHEWPATQHLLITGCSILVDATNVSNGDPPTVNKYQCPCCDFGTAERPAALPKKLRMTYPSTNHRQYENTPALL